MELDELKDSWQAMNAKILAQEQRNAELSRQQQASTVESTLRPLFYWQIGQVVIGILLAGIGGQFWLPRLDDPLKLISGLIVHAYGIALIINGLRVVLRFREIDFGAPLVTLQRRIAKLERTYVLSGWILGLPWWLLWIPMAIVGLTLGGIDILRNAPSGWIWVNVLLGVVGMLATVGLYQWARRSPNEHIRAKVLRLTRGEHLDRANLLLQDLEAFEQV